MYDSNDSRMPGQMREIPAKKQMRDRMRKAADTAVSIMLVIVLVVGLTPTGATATGGVSSGSGPANATEQADNASDSASDSSTDDSAAINGPVLTNDRASNANRSSDDIASKMSAGASPSSSSASSSKGQDSNAKGDGQAAGSGTQPSGSDKDAGQGAAASEPEKSYSARILASGFDGELRGGDELLGESAGMSLIGIASGDRADVTAYYGKHSDWAIEDVAVGGADDGKAEQVEYTSSDNPIEELGSALDELDKSQTEAAEKAVEKGEADSVEKAKEDAIAQAREHGLIALVDTGAPSNSGIEGVSVIGDETGDDDGHATRMYEAMKAVDPDVKVLSIKALAKGGAGTLSSVFAAMKYATSHGAKVINLSLASEEQGTSKAFEALVKEANDTGIVVAGAAGNSNEDASKYVPGGISRVFVVGAADDEGKKIESSNYGKTVDAYVTASSTSLATAKASSWIAANSSYKKLPADVKAAKEFFSNGEGFATKGDDGESSGGEEGDDEDDSDAPIEGEEKEGEWKSGEEGETEELDDESVVRSMDGTAYAAIKGSTMTFFRSTATVAGSNTTAQTRDITDINGTSYTGVYLFTNFETVGTGAVEPTWQSNNQFASIKGNVTTVNVATGSSITPTNCYNWFNNFAGMTSFSITGFDFSNCTNMSRMFENCPKLSGTLNLTGMSSSKVTNMSRMFYGCSSLTSITFPSSFNTASVNNMSEMFYGDYNLTSLNLSSFSVTNVTDFSYCFYNCRTLGTLNLTGWVTTKATNMAYMFFNCFTLTTLDVSGFVTNNVTSFAYMFSACPSGSYTSTAPYVSTVPADTNTNTSLGNTAQYMKLTSLNLSTWKASAGTNTSHMFFYCQQLSSLSMPQFNTSNVTNMSFMFYGMNNLTTLDMSSMDSMAATSMTNMFPGVTKLSSVKLGTSWSFKGSAYSTSGSAAKCQLPAVQNSGVYDGYWTKTQYATVNATTSATYANATTAAILASNYACGNASWAGTWIWHIPSYTISFDVNTAQNGSASGSKTSPQTQPAYRDKTFKFPEPYSGWTNTAGKYFVGWSTNKNATSGTSPSFEWSGTNFSASTTYYAIWSSTTYARTIYISNTNGTASVSAGDLVLIRTTQTAPRSASGTTLSTYAVGYWTDVYGGKTYYGYLTSNGDIGAYTSTSSTYGPLFGGSTTYRASAKKFYCAPNTTVSMKSMAYMFYSCTALTSINLTGITSSDVTSMAYMFHSCNALTSVTFPTTFTTPKVTTMHGMFEKCPNLTTLDLNSCGGFSNTVCTDMSHMFAGCSSLSSLTLGSSFKTPAVTDMSYMFGADTETTTNTGALDYTSLGCAFTTAPINYANFSAAQVQNMQGMFKNCSNMTTCTVNSGFSSSKTTNMSYMFSGCSKLTNLPMGTSYFNTSAVTTMKNMFQGCSALTTFSTASASNFNTSKVTDMSGMFKNCSSLNSLSISTANRFTTAAVTDMSEMFYNTGFTTWSFNYAYFNTSKVQDMHLMFASCAELTSLTISTSAFTSGADLSNVQRMFKDSSKLSTLNISSSSFTLSNSKVTSLQEMFAGCTALAGTSAENFFTKTDTSKISNMSNMFDGAGLTGTTTLSKMETNSLSNAYRMFRNSKATIVYVTEMKMPTSANLSEMFYGCSSLTTVYADDDADWGTGNGSGTNMFYGCTALKGGCGSTLQVVQQNGVSANESCKDRYARVDELAVHGYFTVTTRYVKFDANSTYGGTGEHKNTANPLTVTGETTVPGTKFTNVDSGKSFTREWNTKADGSGVAYKEGETFLPPAGTTTLYAQWANKYVVSYDFNGAPFAREDEEVIGTYTTPSSSKEFDGQVVAHWNTSIDDDGEIYYVGSTHKLSSNLMLYAIWSDDVTVKFDSNGGTGNMPDSVTPVTKNTFAQTQEFEFTGGVQTFTAPQEGDYILETWGAQGGSYDALTNAPGMGGYAKGTVHLAEGEKVYIYVGGQGDMGTNDADYTSRNGGGFNGGGAANYKAGGGGGATDIRIGGSTLNHRVLVAGGGGGAPYAGEDAEGTAVAVNTSSTNSGAASSGTTTLRGSYYGSASYAGYSGTSSAVGSTPSASYPVGTASFGFGADGMASAGRSSTYRSGAGGGGWYGGSAGGNNSSYNYVGGGGGGSSYAYTGGTPVANYKAGSWPLSATQLVNGNASMTSPTGYSETGHAGDGYARISFTVTDALSGMMRVPYCGFSYANKVFSHWNTRPDDSGTSYSPDEYMGVLFDQTLYAIWKDRSTSNVYAVIKANKEMVFFQSDTEWQTGYRTVKDVKGVSYTGYVFKEVELIEATKATDVPWSRYKGKVETVTVAEDQSLSPKSCAYWFYNFNKLKTIYIESFKTDKLTNVAYMFYGCTSLKTIYSAQDADWREIPGNNMFAGCSTTLTGGSNTKWNTSNIHASQRAVLDGGTANPGYFTAAPWVVTLQVGYPTGVESMKPKTTDVIPGDSYKFVNATASTSSGGFSWWRNGFMFAGWKLDGDNTDTVYLPGETYTPTKNVTFTAVWSRPTGGTAYVVVSSDGKRLEFIRSYETYESGTVGTFKDIATYTHSGTVYAGIETDTYASKSDVPWYSHHSTVTTVTVNQNMNIVPVSTAHWFEDFTELTTYRGLYHPEMLLDDENDPDRKYYDESGYIDTTTKITDMTDMFKNCPKLKVMYLSKYFSFRGKHKIVNINPDTGAETSTYEVLPTAKQATPPEGDTSKIATHGTRNYTGKWAHLHRGYDYYGSAVYDDKYVTAPLTNIQLRDTYDDNSYTNHGYWEWEAEYVLSYNVNNTGDIASAPIEQKIISNANLYNILSLYQTDTYHLDGTYSYGDKVFTRKWFPQKFDNNGNPIAGTIDTNKTFRYGASNHPSSDMVLYAKWIAPDEGKTYLLITNKSSQKTIQTTTPGNSDYYEKVLNGSTAYKSGANTYYATNYANAEAVLIRSDENYQYGAMYTSRVDSSWGLGEVQDIVGNSYFYPFIAECEDLDNRSETGTANALAASNDTSTSGASGDFYNYYKQLIVSFKIGDHQIIRPKNTSRWFEGWSNLMSCDLTGLDTSGVTNMSRMFSGCPQLKYKSGTTDFALTGLDNQMTEAKNQITHIDTAKVTDMSYMFAGCGSISTLDLGDFALNQVKTTKGMFSNASAYGTVFTYITPSNVTETRRTYRTPSNSISSYSVYDNNLSYLKLPSNATTGKTSALTDTSYMFYGTSSLAFASIVNKERLDTSKVTDMTSMFEQCGFTVADFSQLSSTFKTTSVKKMTSMFANSTKLTSLKLTTFKNTACEDMSHMFENDSILGTLELNGFTTPACTDMSYMFHSCLALNAPDFSTFDTSNVTTMLCMFQDCKTLSTLNLSSFKGTKLTTMEDMFENCVNMASVNLSNFNTPKLTTMKEAFQNCSKLASLDLSAMKSDALESMARTFKNAALLESVKYPSDFTAPKAYNFQEAYYGCASLKAIDMTMFSLTANNVTFTSMFQGASALKSADFSKIENDKIAIVTRMFEGCSSLESFDLTDFTMSNCIAFTRMFYGCSSLTELDVSTLYPNPNIMLGSTPVVPVVTSMFAECAGLKTIWCNRDTDWSYLGITNSDNMFEGDDVLKGGSGHTIANVRSAGVSDELSISANYAKNDRFNAAGYFTMHEVIVRYDANAPEATGQKRPVIATGEIRVESYEPISNGYWTFVGWTTTEDSEDPDCIWYQPGDALLPWVVSEGGMTLYAQWNNEFTVDYDLVGYTGTTVPSVTQSGWYEIATVNDVFNGQIVRNWNTEVDGSGDTYKMGENIFLTKNLRLYAQWSSQLSLSYDANGGDGTMPSQESNIGRKSTQRVLDYGYKESAQTFTAPQDGEYRLEAWGAQGGSSANGTAGGKGGYSAGTVTLKKGDTLYIFTGGMGVEGAHGTNENVDNTAVTKGGFNGGGAAGGSYASGGTNGGSGGGATDIRLKPASSSDSVTGQSIYERLIVAGGGGGSGYYAGGVGGGTSGASGATNSNNRHGFGGTQTSGGARATSNNTNATAGSFGFGGRGAYSTDYSAGGGGGGGWFGGGGAGTGSSTWPGGGGGGGGSAWVYTSSAYSTWSSSNSALASNWLLPTSGYFLASTSMSSGSGTFKSPSGTDEVGHAGSGYARITFTQQLDLGGQATAAQSSFSRPGYVFANWNTKADGSGDTYWPGDVVLFDRDLILYAQWEEGEQSRAYAILDAAGNMTFFRSYTIYAPGESKTVTDIGNNTYTGRLYTDFETYTGNAGQSNSSFVKWTAQMSQIKTFKVADGQYIQPLSCANWFREATNLREGDVSGFDMSSCTGTEYMFYVASANGTLTKLYAQEDTDWSSLSNITSNSYMFYGRRGLTGSAGTNYLAYYRPSPSPQYYNAMANNNYTNKTYAKTDLSSPTRQIGYFSIRGWSVTYDANGGTGSVYTGSTYATMPWTDTATKGAEYTIKSNFNNLKNGTDAFTGFNTAADGTQDSYSPGDKFTPEHDVTLYAQWRNTKTGGAYAILTPDGELVFFRSNTVYTEDGDYPDGVYDIDGHLLRGHLYSGNIGLTGPQHNLPMDIETMEISEATDVPWANEAHLIKSARVSEGEAITPVSCQYMFNGCSNMESFDTTGFYTSNSSSFQGMFWKCASLRSIDVSEFDTANRSLFNNMFSGCSSLTTLDVSKMNTASAVNMAGMFEGCSSLTSLNLGTSFNTSNVTNISSMFANCSSLKSLDVSMMRTSKATEMSKVFYNMTSLESLNLANFDTRASKTLGDFFGGDLSLSQVSLGTNFRFAGVGVVATAYQGLLPDPLDEDIYKGTWAKGSRYGTTEKTNRELRDEYDTNYSTLTGTWYWAEYETWKLTYNKNAAQATGSMAQGEVLSDHDLVIEDNGFARSDGYYFVNWNTVTNGRTAKTGTTYWPGDVIQLDNDLTVYAQWTLPTEGTAYAILLDEPDGLGHDAGTLVFFRSLDALETGADKTVRDMYNREFKGTLYTGFEAAGITAPWAADKASILGAAVVDKTTISPRTTAGWFEGCSNMTSFDGTGFNTANTATMANMFKDATTLSSVDVTAFNTANVTDFSSMFENASALTELDLSKISTANALNLSRMFKGTSKLSSIDVSKFNTSRVTDMSGMFEDATAISSMTFPSTFTTSNVTDMSSMFKGATRLASLNLPTFNTAKVKNFSEMFANAASLSEIKMSSFSTAAATDMHDMFANDRRLGAVELGSSWSFKPSGGAASTYALLPGAIWKNMSTDQTYAASVLRDTYTGSMAARYEAQWGAAYAVLTDSNELIFFRSLTPYTAGDNQTVQDLFGNEYTGTVYTGIEEEASTIGAANAPWSAKAASITSARVADGQLIMPVDMNYWFYNCSSMTSFDSEGFDTSSVQNMTHLFDGCLNLANIDISAFDTAKVTDLSYMFNKCQRLGHLDTYYLDTSSATNMSHMFAEAKNLTSLDVSGFDTSKVTDMSSMFAQMSRLASIDVTGFDTKKVTDFSEMFYADARIGTLDLSSFDTSKASNMGKMMTGMTGVTSITVPATFSFKGKGIPSVDAQALFPGREWLNSSVPGSEIIMAEDLRDSYDGSNAKWPGTYTSLGTAYAVFTSQYDSTYGAGHLVFFRSMNDYQDSRSGQEQIVTDILGNTYRGIIYTGIETSNYENAPGSVKWINDSIKSVSVAPGQVIQPLSMANWFNAAQTTSGKPMAKTLTSFNGEGFETFNVQSFANMFSGCHSLETVSNMSQWDTSSVLTMSNMFRNCASIEEVDLSGWDVTNVNSTSYMFAMDKTASTWNKAKPTGNKEPAMKSIDLTGWSLDKAQSTDYMFSNLVNLESLDGSSKLVQSEDGTTDHMFYNLNKLSVLDTSGFNTSNVTDMSNMFDGCYNVSQLNVIGFDMSNVTDMPRMFADCASLTLLDVTDWNVGNVVDASEVFAITKNRDGSYLAGKTPALEHIYLPGWSLENAESAEALFENQASLIDVQGSDTLIAGNAISLARTFSGCESLEEANMNYWDTTNVTDMTDMFTGCDNLERAILGYGWTFDGDGSLDDSEKSILPRTAWLNTSVEGSEAIASSRLQREYNPSGTDGYKWPGTYIVQATAPLHITFDANGGTGTVATIEKTYPTDTEVELPAPNFTKAGDWFCDGYTLDAEGEGHLYQTGDIYELSDEHVKFYAHYTPTYKLPMTGQVPMTLMLLFAIVMLGVYVFDPEGRVMRGIRRWQLDRDVNRG